MAVAGPGRPGAGDSTITGVAAAGYRLIESGGCRCSGLAAAGGLGATESTDNLRMHRYRWPGNKWVAILRASH